MATNRRVPKIVKGNDFTGLVPLVQYTTTEGQTTTGPFPLDDATNIKVCLINENQQSIDVDWDTVPERDDILLIYVEGTLTCGFWGLEITGLYQGNRIRSFVERLFELVHSNEQADSYLTDEGGMELDPVLIYDNVAMALGTVMDGAQIDGAIAGYNANRYLSKTQDDTAAGTIRLLKGLQVGNRYTDGMLGEGGVFRKRADGKVELVTDILYARMQVYFDTVEIRKHIHSAGNRVASDAGAKCVRVEYIDANGDVTDTLQNTVLFRCYFKGDDGEQACTNDFQIGDQAFCKVTNASSGSSLYQHNFWRLVIGRNEEGQLTEDGEYWIDLSNREYESINGTLYSGYLSGSEAPRAQDDIIQLGNKIDSTRQGAIIEAVSGSNSPSYQIYQGINDYTLNDKCYVELAYDSGTGRAKVDIFGDAYIGDKGNNPASYIRYNSHDHTLDIKGRISASSTISGQTIDEYIASHSSDWSEEEINVLIHAVTDDIQAQIDGQIEAWFYDYMPVSAVDSKVPLTTITIEGQTQPCHPYYDWYRADGGDTAHETTTERIKHLGDTFYDNSSGYAFRFTRNESTNAFEWTIIEDSAVITALQNAAKAQDTADHKRRIFVLPVSIGDTTYNYPYPPYDVGDLWVNATYPVTGDKTYDNEMLKCTTPKASGDSFDIADWSLANGYAAKLNNFVNNTYAPFVQNISNQVDKKAETWRQNTDPSLAQGWIDSSHVGDLWMDTSANGGNKTYIYQNTGTDANPNYQWVPQEVPTVVFDKIDGKAAIYVGWGDWIVGGESQLRDKDLFIPTADVAPTGSTVTYKRNKVYKWNASNSTWSEIDYTDDTRLLAFLDGYTRTLTNLVSDIEDDIDLAGGRYLDSAVMTAIRNAVGGTTVTEGGLMLTSLLAMRKYNGDPDDEQQKADPVYYTTWGGMNGVYDARENDQHEYIGAKGHGISAWYGGGMVDLEDLSHYWNSSQIATWNAMSAADKAVSALVAKTLFRMDGSGYLASGNITWDNAGNLTVQGQTIKASTYYLNGQNITDALNAILTMFTLEGVGTTASPYVIKANFDLYSVGGITALGQDSQGGGGGSTTLYGLNDVWPDDATNPTKVRGAQPGYVLTFGNDNHWYAAPTAETYVLPQATSGALGGIKIGYNDATPKTYAVALNSAGQAYVAVPWTDHHAWGDISNKPTTISDYGITDAYTKTQVDSLVRLKSVALASDGVLAFELQNGSVSYVDLTHQHDFQEILDKPTTLAGFGITDAKIESGVITLGGNTITPVTSVAMTVPTGFSISGTPISKTGILALSYSSGYEGFTTDLKNMITALYSWFEVDSNGDIKTKDYTSNGSTKHRGFYSPSFISALGQSSSGGGGGGQGDVTWDLLKSSDTRQINISHLAGDANYTGVMSILTGYTTSGKNYKVQEDSNHHLYVNVPWTDNNTTYINGTGLSLSGTTFSINSTYQTYISNGKTAYGWGNHASAGYALQTSLNALEYFNSITRGSDGAITFTTNKSNSTTLDLSHQHSFQELTDKPTTIEGYGITKPSYAFSEITGMATANQIPSIQNINSFNTYVYSAQISRTANTILAAPNGSAGVASFRSLVAADIPSLSWSKITSGKPTTLSGYGITDACTQSTANGLLYTMSLNNDGTINVSTLGGTTKYSIDFTHQHSFFELVDRPTTIDGYSITGGKFVDDITFVNTKGINMLNTANVSKEVMYLSSGNVLVIGSGTSESSYSTYLRGYSVYLKFGTTGATGLILNSSGNVGIGTSSPSCKLHVDGDIYATGGVTALVATSSDIRKKNVVSYNLPLTLNQIADAPTIKFTWKDNAKLGEQVGSIAQYWQKVLPQTIRVEKDDTLSLQYGVAALVSAIITARKVVDHEKRITELEKERDAWKEAYSFLEKAYNELKLKIA